MTAPMTRADVDLIVSEARANATTPDLRALADAGLRQPTNKAQERLSHALNLLDRATSIPAALSVDGEGGLFAEWIAGGVRLTVEVDKLGEIDWLVVKPHHDAVSVTLTDFFVLLRQLDAECARRRPSLQALLALCEDHIARHPDTTTDLAAKWTAER